MIIKSETCNVALIDGSSPGGVSMMTTSSSASEDVMRSSCRGMAIETSKSNGVPDSSAGSVAKIVKLEHAWRRLDGRNDEDRKSTRLNSSHVSISYAVFCLK